MAWSKQKNSKAYRKNGKWYKPGPVTDDRNESSRRNMLFGRTVSKKSGNYLTWERVCGSKFNVFHLVHLGKKSSVHTEQFDTYDEAKEYFDGLNASFAQ